MVRDGDNHVLMIAYHFPPISGSSGLQRTLSFCRYLPAHGWKPLVLTVHPRAYPAIKNDQLADVPEGVPVVRAFALDTQKHLSIRGAYPTLMAMPDRWVTWWLGAVPAGLGLVRRYRPKVIWSTHPIATAHLIGGTLNRLTGVPWVADFRDPMIEHDPTTGHVFPADPAQHRVWRAIERLCASRAARATFCTQGALALTRRRHPEVPDGKWTVIENGYDELPFADAARRAASASPTRGPRVLLHSGLLYASESRNPSAFFDALLRLRDGGQIAATNLRVVLRASGHEDLYGRMIGERGLSELVKLEPAVPYRDALAEMLTVDGLLVFQGYTSNHAIPAKLYEYVRARRPIFAMAHADGDTAKLLRDLGTGMTVPIDDAEKIATGLTEFLRALDEGRAKVATLDQARHYSREARAGELAALFDSIVGRARVPPQRERAFA
jgi:glycosyltransferase involved in cell wall biosynthesis